MIETFLLGTYTKRCSKGIYSIDLNTKTKKLENLQFLAQTENPTYLSKFQDYVFAVSKNSTNGGIIAYHHSGNQLLPIAEQFIEKAVPCYIAYNPENKTIVTANYHDATTRIYDFSMKSIQTLDTKIENATSIHPNQTQSHIHFANYTPDKQYIISCDLGGDHVLTYRLNASKRLELVQSYTSIAGAGPRHIVFHPHLPLAYLICELSATVEVLNFDAQSGKFTRITSQPLFEEAASVKKWASAIKLTKDGRFLYCSNRGSDVLVVFKIDELNGSLTKIQTIATQGKTARDFSLNQTEDFIIVGHQDSDTLSLFERDQTSGLLSLIEKDIFAPEVICLIE